MEPETVSKLPKTELEKILGATTYGMPKTSVLPDDKKPDAKPTPEPIDFSIVPSFFINKNNKPVFVIPSKMNFI